MRRQDLNLLFAPRQIPTPRDLAERFDRIQRALEDLYSRFPVQASEVAVGQVLKMASLVSGAQVHFGVVQSTGVKISGTNFVSSRTALGTYKLLFPKSFATTPAVVGVDIQGTQRTFSAAIPEAKTVNVVMSNGTGAKEDIAFAFLLIG